MTLKSFSDYIGKFIGQFTNYDIEIILNDSRKKTLVYLDPPYFEQGAGLYYHSFAQDDHVRLANCLKNTSHYWILSYDDCPEIRSLYQDFTIKTISANYCMTGKIVQKTELLITGD